MTLKKLAGTIHLWLGLVTGLVVFIIAITGAIYCFAPELQQLQSYRTVQESPMRFLPPSQIKEIAANELPGKLIQRIYYEGKNKAVMALFYETDIYTFSVFINPYTGKVLKVRDNDKDFLSVVLKIHRTLLIPYGHDIIRWSTVIFVIILITGIILWWPKNSRTARHGFLVKWSASPKRLNYDLHKVLGFYASWLAVLIAITGLMFAFEGFADFTYKLTGASRSVVKKKPPTSDTTVINRRDINGVDLVWQLVEPDLHTRYAAALFVLPAGKAGPILLRANPEAGTLYKTDFRYFDQYTGREIPGAYVWGKYKDAHTTADHIRRMNYDIHTGAIFGLPGRIALFFVALIVASLPVTGFYFWWSKKRKARRMRLQHKQYLARR